MKFQKRQEETLSRGYINSIWPLEWIIWSHPRIIRPKVHNPMEPVPWDQQVTLVILPILVFFHIPIKPEWEPVLIQNSNSQDCNVGSVKINIQLVLKFNIMSLNWTLWNRDVDANLWTFIMLFIGSKMRELHKREQRPVVSTDTALLVSVQGVPAWSAKIAPMTRRIPGTRWKIFCKLLTTILFFWKILSIFKNFTVLRDFFALKKNLTLKMLLHFWQF